MNLQTLTTVTANRREGSTVLRDYVALSKPRLSLMVVLTVGVAGLVSASPGSGFLVLLPAMIGLFLVSASGCAWNQYLERYVDWMMPRTARRPLPDQRLTATQVAVFGAVTLGAGMACLAALVNWQSALVAGVTWIVYVWIYTPMKAHSWLNTFVGAVSGALPVLVGSTAIADGALAWPAWLLFLVVYIWQFPHFMAIAWLYREDYRLGNLKMASTVPGAPRLTGWLSTVFAVLLVPVTVAALWPAGVVEGILLAAGLGLAIWYLVESVRFQRDVSDENARKLFRVSLVHLSLYMVVLSLSVIDWQGAGP